MLRNYKWFLGSLLLLVNLFGQVKLSVKTIPKKVNFKINKYILKMVVKEQTHDHY